MRARRAALRYTSGPERGCGQHRPSRSPPRSAAPGSDDATMTDPDGRAPEETTEPGDRRGRGCRGRRERRRRMPKGSTRPTRSGEDGDFDAAEADEADYAAFDDVDTLGEERLLRPRRRRRRGRPAAGAGGPGPGGRSPLRAARRGRTRACADRVGARGPHRRPDLEGLRHRRRGRLRADLPERPAPRERRPLRPDPDADTGSVGHACAVGDPGPQRVAVASGRRRAGRPFRAGPRRQRLARRERVAGRQWLPRGQRQPGGEYHPGAVAPPSPADRRRRARCASLTSRRRRPQADRGGSAGSRVICHPGPICRIARHVHIPGG